MEEGMDLLTPLSTGILVALFMGIQIWINKGRFDALERRMTALEERVDRRFDQLSAELLQVALAMRPRSEPQTG
jgi:hypothetical protein